MFQRPHKSLQSTKSLKKMLQLPLVVQLFLLLLILPESHCFVANTANTANIAHPQFLLSSSSPSSSSSASRPSKPSQHETTRRTRNVGRVGRVGRAGRAGRVGTVGGLSFIRSKRRNMAVMAVAGADEISDEIVEIVDATSKPKDYSKSITQHGECESSLASSYVIRILTENSSRDADSEMGEMGGALQWELMALEHWERDLKSINLETPGVGEVAMRALHDCSIGSIGADANDTNVEHDANDTNGTADQTHVVAKLTCRWSKESKEGKTNVGNIWSIEVSIDGPPEVPQGVPMEVMQGVPQELICTLSRVMVQSAAMQIARIADESNKCKGSEVNEEQTLLRITLPLLEGNGCVQLLLSDLVHVVNAVNVVDEVNGFNGANVSDGAGFDEVIPSNEKKLNLNLKGVKFLFQSLHSNNSNTSNNPNTSNNSNGNLDSVEMVDMVNHQGEILGSLPRPMVHKWNILHRGVGVLVTRDVDILGFLDIPDVDIPDMDILSNGGHPLDSQHPLPQQNQPHQPHPHQQHPQHQQQNQQHPLPAIYLHQRTATKRIFPSLYDMFVGGVSSTNEGARYTAAREVAEELGLRGGLNALDGLDALDASSTATVKECKKCKEYNPLSEELFQCTICTSYNRCLVSFFTYTCYTGNTENTSNTGGETISWQKEEVQWGDFVDYEIVERAAGLSIGRLVEEGVWPGSFVVGGVDEDGDGGIAGVGGDGSAEASSASSIPKVEDDNPAMDSVTDLETDSDVPTARMVRMLKEKYSYDHPWETWGFVPDGLLVWDAWLRWFRWFRRNGRNGRNGSDGGDESDGGYGSHGREN